MTQDLHKLRSWGRQVAGPAFLVILFLTLTAVSWRKWSDFLTDFGRELYTPWQLASGKLLYADVASLFGPFSQLWNAVWFKIFGVSLTTLAVINLLIVVVLVYLVYDLFVKACDRSTATLVSAAFLALFAFAHPLKTGNYNFVSPYSHEATHGVVLSVAMLWFLTAYLRRGGRYLSGLAGGSLGLAFLTKPEIFAAGVGAAAAAFWLLHLSRSATKVSIGAALMSFVAGFAIPLVLFLAYFSLQMPFVQPLRATVAAWIPVFTARPLSSPFYLSISGLDDPAGYAWSALKMIAWLAAVFSIGVFLEWRVGRRIKYQVLFGGVAGGVVLISGAILYPDFWNDLGLVLPLLSALIGGWLFRLFLSHRDDLPSLQRLFPLVIWSVFSVILLAKTILNTRLYHYGFFLAFPATLLCIAALVYALPRLLSARWGGGMVFRPFASAVLVLFVGLHLGESIRQYRAKNTIVGQGYDRILIHDPDDDPASFAVLRALERIESLIAPEATLLVLPEGVMFNYLTRRRSPTRYINFMPPELDTFAEANILAAFEEQSPDFILLVHKDTRSDYRVGPFGSELGYGREIMDWVRKNYFSLETILNEPLKDDRFGIEILARRISST